jgi:hypothetical protein
MLNYAFAVFGYEVMQPCLYRSGVDCASTFSCTGIFVKFALYLQIGYPIMITCEARYYGLSTIVWCL